MFSKSNSLISHVSVYRWLFLLTILLLLIALLPIGQRAERQSQGQGQQHRLLDAPREPNKKTRLNAVPGEILVRFRPGSKGN